MPSMLFNVSTLPRDQKKIICYRKILLIIMNYLALGNINMMNRTKQECISFYVFSKIKYFMVEKCWIRTNYVIK